MSVYTQHERDCLRAVATCMDKKQERAAYMQAAATYALAEQTRLQTLLFCRMFGDISDAAGNPRFESGMPNGMGVDCISALTDDDLRTLGIPQTPETFGA